MLRMKATDDFPDYVGFDDLTSPHEYPLDNCDPAFTIIIC